MPRTTVNKPKDDLFVLERFEINPKERSVQEFSYPGLGQIVQAPSSYILKYSDMLRLEISQVNPAWLYSGLDYANSDIKALVTFKSNAVDVGLMTFLPIANTKRTTQVDSLIGISLPSVTYQSWIDNIPVNYYGAPYEDRLPGQSGNDTILSKIIDESKIKVTMLSSCEFEIEVLDDLTEDAWFYIPVGNPKGIAQTIWGQAGFESTLPEGACAGLIKLRTETMLNAQKGQYLVTGDALDAVAAPSARVYQNTQQITYAASATAPVPPWYEDLFTETVKTTKQWQQLNALVENDTDYMACSFITKTSTVGTGLFVRDKNKPATYSFGRTGLGLSHMYNLDQSTTPLLSVPVSEFIQVDGFLEQVARSGGMADLLPENTVIPFAASELQYESKLDGPFHPLQDPWFNYTYMVHNTTLPIGITPTYLPPNAAQHCYVPKLACAGSTKVNMLSPTKLTDVVSLTLKPSDTWLRAFEDDKIPDIILESKIIDSAPLSNPIGDFSRGKMGFYGNRNFTQRANWSSDGKTVVSYTRTYTGALYWDNPDLNPTVGMDYLQVGDKSVCNALFSAMIMAFVGMFPAGTPVGKYTWKPFKNTQQQSGCLDAADPQFIASHATPRLEPETSAVPLLGHNIITGDVKTIQWLTSNKSDGYYTARRVLEYVADDNSSTTHIAAQYYMTVEMETVPLVGYPLANKPMLIDIDDLSGEWACDVDDMNMTAPFYDKALDRWIVVGASAQMKKMYRIEVAMDETETYCTGFLRVRDSRELLSTPYGNWQKLLGLCHTKDIHYADGTENDHLVMYGITDAEPSTIDGGTNLVVATCRTYMEWDADKDTVSRIKSDNTTAVPNFIIDADTNWPYSIAVMYPWLYVLGFMYTAQPTDPTIDPAAPDPAITGSGWQMCLWRIDITSGLIQDTIPLKSCETYRFSFGLPANDVDSRKLYRQDKNSIGSMMKYKYGNVQLNVLPTSAALPKISRGSEFPSVSGLCCVAGNLLAFSNYSEKLVMINPITGFIEELGFNIFPFTYPFNRNVTVEKEVISTVAKFGGHYFHTSHPFFGMCLGDGTPPNNYGAGIDIQDVTNGQTLVRLVKVKNNLLRDQISDIEITVPDPSVLPNSDMLFVSKDGETTQKSITIDGPINPCDAANFYVHLEPNLVDPSVVDDKILLYVNAKFARKTMFFGYFVRLGV